MDELIKKYKLALKHSYLPVRMKDEYQKDKIGSVGLIKPMNHILWMLDQLHDLSPDKQNRWLGFIQGILYAKGYYSLIELREHIRELNV